MAELNFGLLNPPGSQSIGNAFVTGMDQGQEARARDLQMQQSMRQGQREELQYKKMQAEEDNLNKFYSTVAENGGPKDPIAMEDQMIGSRVPQYVQLGYTLRTKRLALEQDRKRYAEANAPAPAAGAGPMPPAVVPEPGSFGADVMGRRAANPFAPRTNMLDGASTEVNNLGAPPQVRPQIDALNARINANLALGTEQGNKTAEMLQKQADNLSRRYTVGTTLMGAGGEIVGTAPEKPSTPPSMVAEYTFAKTPDGGGFRGSFQDFVTARAEAGRARRPEAAPRTQQVTMSNGGLGIVNMDTGVITPSTMGGAPVKGKPSAFAEKTALQRAQMGKDLTFAITQLTDITKDGGLIDQSTGSGAGRLTDVAARFVGQALPGDIAIGKIAPIADLALKMVPRFEGPQSNADTKSYNEAAGQLKDSSLPTKIRKEAGKVVLRIMQARKNQFATADMAAEGATGGGEAAPATNIDALLNKYK